MRSAPLYTPLYQLPSPTGKGTLRVLQSYVPTQLLAGKTIEKICMRANRWAVNHVSKGRKGRPLGQAPLSLWDPPSSRRPSAASFVTAMACNLLLVSLSFTCQLHTRTYTLFQKPSKFSRYEARCSGGKYSINVFHTVFHTRVPYSVPYTCYIQCSIHVFNTSFHTLFHTALFSNQFRGLRYLYRSI